MAIETRTAVEVKELAAGEYIIDFGVNFAGIFEANIHGAEGAEIRFYPGERLSADGSLDQTTSTHSSNLPLYDSYIVGSKGEGTYHLTFNYHGFRYLRVTGLSYKPEKEDFTGIVISTASEQMLAIPANAKQNNLLKDSFAYARNMHKPMD